MKFFSQPVITLSERGILLVALPCVLSPLFLNQTQKSQALEHYPDLLNLPAPAIYPGDRHHSGTQFAVKSP